MHLCFLEEKNIFSFCQKERKNFVVVSEEVSGLKMKKRKLFHFLCYLGLNSSTFFEQLLRAQIPKGQKENQ